MVLVCSSILCLNSVRSQVTKNESNICLFQTTFTAVFRNNDSAYLWILSRPYLSIASNGHAHVPLD